MTDDDGVLLYAWRGCLFRVSEGVQPAKAGSLFFARHLPVRPEDRVLEIGAGLGVAAVLAARVGARVVATDVLPEAVAAISSNALLNGVAVDARLGDCYGPVAGERFDLICTNPPQMPTPPGRERDDAQAAADNGGIDGWAVLDAVIEGAREHLDAPGRLVFSLFAFLGRKAAFTRLERHGFTPSVLATELQAFPRIGFERLDHIRSLDREGTLPPGLPSSVERLLIQGALD